MWWAVFVVIVATSCDFVQWLTGVEYLFGLLTIYTVIETVNGSTAPVDLWIYLFFCMGFYVLSGLSYRFLP